MRYINFVKLLLYCGFVCVGILPQTLIANEQSVGKPLKTILYIGNSHTFTHDVPFLVDSILKTIGTPNHYTYTAITEGGVGLKYHWENTRTQEALGGESDFTIIQPHSGAIISDTTPKALSFHQYGGYLLRKAKKTASKVALYQTWIPLASGYGTVFKTNIPLSPQQIPAFREEWYKQQNIHYATLAYKNNADVIPVAQSWYKAEKKCPNIVLVGDDNHHASIHGAYLSALTIARYINGYKIIPKGTFAPTDISVPDAQCLVGVVNSNI